MILDNLSKMVGQGLYPNCFPMELFVGLDFAENSYDDISRSLNVSLL
jgi:hypothetical protein